MYNKRNNIFFNNIFFIINILRKKIKILFNFQYKMSEKKSKTNSTYSLDVDDILNEIDDDEDDLELESENNNI